MKYFIVLHNALSDFRGKDILVNLANITHIENHGVDASCIFLTANKHIIVQETIPEILKIISEL